MVSGKSLGVVSVVLIILITVTFTMTAIATDSDASTSLAESILSVEDATVTAGDTATVDITLSDAPSGISGFTISVELSRQSTAEITEVVIPNNLEVVNSTISKDGQSVTLKVVDLYNTINSGDSDISLASLIIQGQKAGSTDVSITPTRIDDKDGNPISVNSQSGTLSVTPPSETTLMANSRADSIDLSLSGLPKGLAGYEITISIPEGSITDVSFPSSIGITDKEVNGDTITIRAVDTNENIQPGGENVWIGSISISGTSSPTPSISVKRLDDDFGYPIPYSIVNAEKLNTPPSKPSNPKPADGISKVETSKSLEWSSGDPDGDSVTYDVYFGTSPNPTFYTSTTSTSVQVDGLNAGTTYYWKVVADDGQETSTGGVWTFTTSSSADGSVSIDNLEFTDDQMDGPLKIDGGSPSRLEEGYLEYVVRTDNEGERYDVRVVNEQGIVIGTERDNAYDGNDGAVYLDLEEGQGDLFRRPGTHSLEVIIHAHESGDTTRRTASVDVGLERDDDEVTVLPTNPETGESITLDASSLSQDSGGSPIEGYGWRVFKNPDDIATLVVEDAGKNLDTIKFTPDEATEYQYTVVNDPDETTGTHIDSDDIFVNEKVPTPSMSIEGFSVPSTVTAGESFSAKVDMSNSGSAQANYLIRFKIDGKVEEVEAAEVDPEDSRSDSASFSLTPGTYEVTAVIIDGQNNKHTRSRTITVKSNDPPSSPSSPTPTAGANDVGTEPTLEWSATDPDGDSLSYTIRLEKGTSAPETVVASDLSSQSYTLTDLDEDSIYYWQIVVEDEHGTTTKSPVWSFTTEGKSLDPTASLSVTPSNPVAGGTITLDASESHDPDSDDSELSYDWSLVESPSKASVDLPTGESGTVTAETAGAYQFRVTVTDGSGASDTTSTTITVAGPPEQPPSDGGGGSPIEPFSNTSSLPPAQTTPNSLAGKIQADATYSESVTVEVLRETASNYSLAISAPDETENVTIYLQTKTISASQDIDNLTMYLDGEQHPFIVDEDAGTGQSAWVGFQIENFSTRTITFTSGIWTVKRVAYGFQPAIATGDEGTSHISYYDGDNLGYATLEPTGWQTQTVDAKGPHIGQESAIAVDSNGTPHITYNSDASGELRYAVNRGSQWTIEVVDSVDSPYASIAIDPVSHTPAIAYHDSGVKIAEKRDGAWDISAIDSSGSAPSLAFDSEGDPHIAYYDTANGTLKYATRNNGYWQLQTIGESDGIGSWGYGIELELTASDQARIAYIGPAAGLRYASWNGTGWQIDTVDTAFEVRALSLELDSEGTPHVAYGSGYGSEVRYALNDGSWTIEEVSSTMGDQGIAISLDAAGRPVIVYEGSKNNGDLNYATKSDRSESSPPVPRLTANTTDVTVGHPVRLNANQSTDPDGDSLTFAWDLDNDGEFDDAEGPIVTPILNESGTHTVEVRVFDGKTAVTFSATIHVETDEASDAGIEAVRQAPSTVLAGESISITVNISVNETVNGLALDENPGPLELSQQSMSPSGTYKSSEHQWLWLSTDSQTGTVQYTVAVPSDASSGTTYSLSGTVSTSTLDPVPVTGDKEVVVRRCVAGAVSGEDKLIGLREIQRAIYAWAEENPIAGKAIGLRKVQRLIHTWAQDTQVTCGGT